MTIRELVDMAVGAQRERWDHTAQLLAAQSAKAISDVRRLNPFRRKEKGKGNFDSDAIERMYRSLKK